MGVKWFTFKRNWRFLMSRHVKKEAFVGCMRYHWDFILQKNCKLDILGGLYIKVGVWVYVMDTLKWLHFECFGQYSFSYPKGDHCCFKYCLLSTIVLWLYGDFKIPVYSNDHIKVGILVPSACVVSILLYQTLHRDYVTAIWVTGLHSWWQSHFFTIFIVT